MDERWIVLDVDRWPTATLARICQEAKQRDWGTGISNPCFEIWLQLHFTDAPVPQDPKQALHRLRQEHAPGENTWPWTRDRIETAIQRARSLDTRETERGWPDAPGTHVYRLASKLLAG